MRVYFEKPRTTVGWKGLINDPHMDHTFDDINEGLRIARNLLLTINDSGLPTAGEFLDMITPQYVADLMSWGLLALEPQNLVHRELSSGFILSCWFKMVQMAPLKLLMQSMRRITTLFSFSD